MREDNKRPFIMRIQNDNDVVLARQEARKMAVQLGFNLLDQTKIATATSELARNTLLWGGGGTVSFENINTVNKKGLKITFEDNGPGIEDIELAMKDGYTTGNGLGFGLGGAKRLVDEFHIESTLGKGTKVTIIKFK